MTSIEDIDTSGGDRRSWALCAAIAAPYFCSAPCDRSGITVVKVKVLEPYVLLQTRRPLLTCQLLGEIAVRGLGCAIPGPVLGLALLVYLLRVMPKLAEHIRPTVSVKVATLTYLFVPGPNRPDD